MEGGGYSFMNEVFGNQNGNSCFSYGSCTFNYTPCKVLHPEARYTDASAAWVLIASIIVFFMKAGFMLVEIAFARNPKEKRYVVVLKHQDAFASAFGFFLIGYDQISRYLSPYKASFFRVTDPVLWFFKFTFASNAATIIGGCLVTNRYKLRLPAAFISSFVISGIIHPIVALIIWSDNCYALSPYRFCDYGDTTLQQGHNCSWHCPSDSTFRQRMYILDFAGGGAVHLIGGMAGLVICLFAKFQEWKDQRRTVRYSMGARAGAEAPEEMEPEGFWDWMYPVHGGEETVSEAALGVIILWFCWFAFNCGSAESIESGFKLDNSTDNPYYPFYGIPAVIAINMIMAGASGGMVAIIIAVWAQIRYRTESVNANEIANGVLSALVSITAGCAFVDYWGAVLTGVFGVLFYHLGCFLEYKFKIKDTARVVPVHAVCGLWSLIATGLFLGGSEAECNLHAAFEGLCYCSLRLPHLSYIERLGAQIIGAMIMITMGLCGSFITYFILYIIPISPFVWVCERVFFLSRRDSNGVYQRLVYRGGWLLTTPEEDFDKMDANDIFEETSVTEAVAKVSVRKTGIQHNNRGNQTTKSNFGTRAVSKTNTYSSILTPPQEYTYTMSTGGTGTTVERLSTNSRTTSAHQQLEEEDETTALL